MADGQASFSKKTKSASSASSDTPPLDFKGLPTVYVLPSHLSSSELHAAENELSERGAPPTYDIKEANLVVGNVSKPKRAKFELQSRQVAFRDSDTGTLEVVKNLSGQTPSEDDTKFQAIKRRKLRVEPNLLRESLQPVEEIATTTDSGSEPEKNAAVGSPNQHFKVQVPMSSLGQSPVSSSHVEAASPEPCARTNTANKIRVVKLDWLKDSIAAGRVQSLASYLVYEGELADPSDESKTPPPDDVVVTTTASASTIGKRSHLDHEESRRILERARAEAKPIGELIKGIQTEKSTRRYHSSHRFASSKQSIATSSRSHSSQPPRLLRQTTSEHDETIEASSLPDWVRQGKIYSCERATPLDSPNDAFISQLKKIKLARLLTNDEIGVRAYSTSIASIAAYPHLISSPAEILTLPGCDQKIAHLFREWQTSTNGRMPTVERIEADPALKVLRLFYDIWGVGAKTAREFYHDKKWQDLDDIVEYGWNSLTRVQQIGVKYYEEFQQSIPRSEVESIASVVERHAKHVVDDRIQCIIVGGYRRGKPESGDVDIILSHPEQSATAGLVDRVVQSLETDGWITHTLTLNLTNTKRNQETLPYVSSIKGAAAGFDTLDKALVVWQDQSGRRRRWTEEGEDRERGRKEEEAGAKKTPSPNPKPTPPSPPPHRRVDIIISPWRTIGCAVAGWTSGTTFQRDLRRYAKKVKGWKFDSSGVMERGTGKWIDLEGWTDEKTRCGDWREAERRVFEGLGLVYREPWERCTG
ncbi:MAG: hypothetical protein Q9190_005228 [Brigantiaea leucoxantha]